MSGIKSSEVFSQQITMKNSNSRDYSLTGASSRAAVARGLAEANWYRSPVPKDVMRELLRRTDGPAIRDTVGYFTVLLTFGWATTELWGTWWAVSTYLIYAVFYGTGSDSRWHECSHGTAFKTDWMNSWLYEVASFMVMRESVVWRWSHVRHHSDTLVVGRDPEVQITRPTEFSPLLLSVFNIGGYRTYFPALLLHSMGKFSESELQFIPASEHRGVIVRARITLIIHAGVLVGAALAESWLPVFLITIPNFFGTWLMIVHNTTQHAGLPENVLDHRLNCRTVYMNPISRFIYWNMNYHVEHHMYPLVPYHALPRLHEAIRSDCPAPYRSIASAWREIIPAIWRQATDPDYQIMRKLPDPVTQVKKTAACPIGQPDQDGWVSVCDESKLLASDVMRFDCGRKTYALAKDHLGEVYALEGMCTHGNSHLADGVVIDGSIECAKHNGRFNLTDGSAARKPVCKGVATYPVKLFDGKIQVNVKNPLNLESRPTQSVRLKVVQAIEVTPFIREIQFEAESKISYQPGDYLRFSIPQFQELKFSEFRIPAQFESVWNGLDMFRLVASNPDATKSNCYSFASTPELDEHMNINVRIALPSGGTTAPPGSGSAYMFGLRIGDAVVAEGPFGEFHIRATQREMVYIAGGSGMAPVRSHLAHLLEIESTQRKISFWYGARTEKDLYYLEYFRGLERRFDNFKFSPVVSMPSPEDHWKGLYGAVHEVAFMNYLSKHRDLASVEFYLCGPPGLIKSCQDMLLTQGVEASQILFDEF